MKFIDLKAQYDLIRDPLNAKVLSVLEHGQFVMGPEVYKIEQQLAQMVGVSHCVSLSSGTDALLASLMALGVGAGDEVITTPFTFVATAEVIALLGAVPIFVDIDPVSYNISPHAVADAVTSRTRAIVPVSLYGQCYDADGLSSVAQAAGLPVIEDGAQSFGASIKGKMSCSLGDIGCTSFFPSKPLGCYGDGGACFTDDEGIANALGQIRNHGQDRRYHHSRLGLNGRLDTLQAAVLLAKMDQFQKEILLRSAIGDRYTHSLLELGAHSTFESETGLLVPHVPDDHVSVYAQYTIQVDDREALLSALDQQNIPAVVHYPIPLHRQPAFVHFPVRGSLIVSERVASRVVSLPMHPYLTADDQDRIIDNVVKACGCGKR